MYCTGGVRCERASSLLRLHGVEDLYQLSGGIHAYMDTFPEGGFFRGKNFVYDPRIALSYPRKEEVVGRCRICSTSFDDYSAKTRCRRCRMLQLVCDSCRVHDERFRSQGIVCEFCS